MYTPVALDSELLHAQLSHHLGRGRLIKTWLRSVNRDNYNKNSPLNFQAATSNDDSSQTSRKRKILCAIIDQAKLLLSKVTYTFYKMDDDYFHPDCNLIYITENIPGPVESSEEYLQLIDNFNSQIMKHCECKECTLGSCECLQGLPTTNLELLNQNYKRSVRKFRNPVTINECNSLCKCLEQCLNRIVQKGPRKNLTIQLCTNSQKGLGLFSQASLPQGTFICEYAGEVITKQEAERRQQNNLKKGKMNYIFCLNEHSNGKIFQTFVDPSHFGNVGRYINHSCEPNCFVTPVRVDTLVPKLAIFTCLNVLPNEELCFDYGCNSTVTTDDQVNKKPCLCGSKYCRSFMPFDNY